MQLESAAELSPYPQDLTQGDVVELTYIDERGGASANGVFVSCRNGVVTIDLFDPAGGRCEYKVDDLHPVHIVPGQPPIYEIPDPATGRLWNGD